MKTEQIFALVNETAEQALGKSAIKVLDTSTLVSLGNAVLSSSNNTEAFLNTLIQKVGRVIYSHRKYRNKLGDMMLNDFEYGAILQKIKARMPKAEADQSFNLEDGESVDHYAVNKPKVDQKLFVTRTPYQFHVTIQRTTLKEAFLSPEGIYNLIGIIIGEVRNAIEYSLENLGRDTISNYIAEADGNRVINLLTEYNALHDDSTLTANTALYDESFLRFAIGRIKKVIKKMSDLSVTYSGGDIERFTPEEDLRIKVLSDLETNLETVVQWAAFNDKYVKLNGFQELNYWQSEKTPMNVQVKRASDGTEKTVANVVAIVHDRDALGMYKIEEDILTTPVNAGGRYYNIYWHEQQLWFNDLTENFAVFTLN